MRWRGAQDTAPQGAKQREVKMDEIEFMHEEERKMKEEKELKECQVLGGNFEDPEDAKEFVKFLEKKRWVVEYLPNVSGCDNNIEEVQEKLKELDDEFSRQ